MSWLLLASGNAHKRVELARILGPDVEVRTPADLSLNLNVDEDGQTFADNAALKARAYAEASGALSVADDSGLCVDALDGAPGLRSARYAQDLGRGAGDKANRACLLAQMAGLPASERGAHFTCAIAVYSPGGELRIFEGRCPGRITTEERGAGGFGYDPLFAMESGQTFAELPAAHKNRISHRGQALALARPYILQQLAASV